MNDIAKAHEARRLYRLLSPYFVSNGTSPPQIGCRVYDSAATTLTTATSTALTFDLERYDTDDMHDTTTNPSRITCTRAGKHAFWAHVRFASNATGFREVAIRVNGSIYIAIQDMPAISGVPIIVSCAGQFDMAVGDYAEVVVYQNSGGNLNVEIVGAYSAEFAAHRLV